jgi:TPR repeat protein
MLFYRKGVIRVPDKRRDSHAQIKRRLEAAIKKAEEGDLEIMRLIAFAYAKGEYLPKDCLAAEAWYRKAAELDDDYSKKELAKLLTESNGVARDYGEAFEIYHDLMLDCDLDGMEGVGIAYKLGRGVEKDEEKGSYFIKQAFEIELDLMESEDKDTEE